MRNGKNILLLTLFLLAMVSGKLFSQNLFHHHEEHLCEVDYSTLNWVGDRIYFTPDQFILSDKGIFVLLEDVNGMLVKVLISQVNFEEAGLFVLAEHLPSPQADFCRYGHPVCRKCGRCTSPGCPTPPCRCKSK